LHESSSSGKVKEAAPSLLVWRGRGRGRGRTGGDTKRDVLKMQLEVRDIDMDILPVGMERRRLNQSYWEPKCVFPHLFIGMGFSKHRDILCFSFLVLL